MYFLYGESVIYYFKHILLVDKMLLPLATHHRFLSFVLYVMGWFIPWLHWQVWSTLNLLLICVARQVLSSLWDHSRRGITDFNLPSLLGHTWLSTSSWSRLILSWTTFSKAWSGSSFLYLLWSPTISLPTSAALPSAARSSSNCPPRRPLKASLARGYAPSYSATAWPMFLWNINTLFAPSTILALTPWLVWNASQTPSSRHGHITYRAGRLGQIHLPKPSTWPPCKSISSSSQPLHL